MNELYIAQYIRILKPNSKNGPNEYLVAIRTGKKRFHVQLRTTYVYICVCKINIVRTKKKKKKNKKNLKENRVKQIERRMKSREFIEVQVPLGHYTHIRAPTKKI